jgi:serine protease
VTFSDVTLSQLGDINFTFRQSVMMLRIAGVILLSSVLHFLALGQSGDRAFKMPVGIAASDVEAGAVWVKIKPAFKDMFQLSQAGNRIPNLQAKQIKAFVNTHSRNKNAARMGPKKVQIDISLFYKISFDKSKPVETYINELYSTGYFEIVEPVVHDKPLFTPNDPLASQQYYLNLIRANEAWDVTQGSASIVIGVVDTGGDMNHPDLQNNIYVDPADPTDGIDNDNDGYIDNNRGWDFSGSDVAQIGTPGYTGDNDPSITKGNRFIHGTMVAGCASATTNDGVGISGVGFKSKLLFTKHYADNQPDNSTNYSSDLYQGVLYAATHGAKIINCSWGRTSTSLIAQAIITHVTVDLGCLVVAAAGNSNNEIPLYPAAYDHVLAVASSDENDLRSTFSNYGRHIDITAPGTNIYTTTYDNAYRTDSGSSLAAPIVSGAAALVWAQRPTLTGLQIAEQLRISADEDLYDNNPTYTNKLGKGRLDIVRALTFQSPSIRASKMQLVKDNGQPPAAGETANLYFDFTNYLKASSSALAVAITSSSPYVSIGKGTISLGAIGENQTVRNMANPLRITLAANLPLDQEAEIMLKFTDGAYNDFQVVAFALPSFININENNIITTMTAAGRIGFGNIQSQTNGAGFIYDSTPLLYEMGLIMGTSSSNLFDNVRATGGAYNQEFTAASILSKNTPGQRAYSEITSSFRNAPTAGTETLIISQRSLVWNEDPYRNFVILEYKIKNVTSNPVTGFYMGLFADWDIVSGGAGDRASWEPATRLGYVFPAIPSSLPQAGIQELNGKAQYYAIDNDNSISGNPLGIYDGFADNEKYSTISSGLGKTQAGMTTSGGDVSHVVGSGPYSINAGGEITIAFALHGALTATELRTSAKYADSVYNFTFKAPQPSIADVGACYNSNVILRPTGATTFKLYKAAVGGAAIESGTQFELTSVTKDTTFYIANADKSYESLRTPVTISVTPIPTIDVLGSLEFCHGGSVTLMASDGEDYTWSTGDKTKSIEVDASGEFSVVVENDGVKCSSIGNVKVLVNPSPSASFTISPEILAPGEEVTFINNSSGAVSWQWDFGDGETSTIENPTHTYIEDKVYTVLLTATSDKACEATASMQIGSITGTEKLLHHQVKLYPNPVNDRFINVNRVEGTFPLQISIFNSQGKIILEALIKAEEVQHAIDVQDLANGVYLFQVKSPSQTMAEKVVIQR